MTRVVSEEKNTKNLVKDANYRVLISAMHSITSTDDAKFYEEITKPLHK